MATNSEHRLVRIGKGSQLWGECTCEIDGRGRMWAWIGSLAGDKGRLAQLKAAHAEHVAFEATDYGQQVWADMVATAHD